jgi:uncharacterized pyridoxal phosphate-containing UPF0001 family protein
VLSSDENTKSGIPPNDVLDLVKYIKTDCPKLSFRGLMSMGILKDIEGFKVMYDLKQKLVDDGFISMEDCILSMGTSADYIEAVY